MEQFLFFCDTVQNNLYNKRVRLTKKRASATGNFLSGKREGGGEREGGGLAGQQAVIFKVRFWRDRKERQLYIEIEIHRDRVDN
jgi:hypothetical protein